MPKLTLHIQDELIAAAKIEAAERKTSVSKLVSDFFRALAAEGETDAPKNLPPITASLIGSLQGADTQHDRKDQRNHLDAKHS
ncbi:MAG: hypothetical protein ACJAVK_001845 [Akkermansiaceae bacterium]|jgi:hypothetical protein